MLLSVLTLTQVYTSRGCSRTVPTEWPYVTPPGTTPPLVCECPLDLYSDSLCPPNGPCDRNPGAVTYGPPPLCPVTVNCQPTDYIRYQFSDNTYINNIRVRDFHQLADIQCVNGQWRYYGQAEFDKVLRHVVCYSVAIPTRPGQGRKTRKAETQSSCGKCSSLENSTEIDLCPSQSNCSTPILKSVNGTGSCEELVVECPFSSLAVQLKSGLSMIVYPQDIYCNEVWIYDDGKQSHEVEGMLCLSKEQHKENYSRCLSSCPPLKQICPACDGFDDGVSPNCTSILDCGTEGNVVVSKHNKDIAQARFQAYVEDNTLLSCVNGSWIVNINDTEVQLMDDELISCKSLNISSLTKS